MPRSYFSRITKGGSRPALLPPRPISTLWKSARLENSSETVITPATTREPESIRPTLQQRPQSFTRSQRVLPVGAPANSATRSSARIHNGNHPALPEKSEAAPRKTTKIAVELSTPKKQITAPNHIKESAVLPARPAAIAVHPKGAAKTAPGKDVEHRRAFTPSTPVTAKEIIPHRGEPHLQRPGHTAGKQGHMVIAATELQPEPPVRKPDVHKSADSTAVHTHNPVVVLDPPPRQPRTTLAVEAREEPQPQKQQKSVHIGKVEVQIVPPPAAVRRTQPAAPKRQLARGYSLWPRGPQIWEA